MSLRDALLKAGKIDKQKAREAATEARRERRQKGGHAIEQEQRAASEQAHAQRLAQQREENRQRAEAQRLERERHEALMRVKNIVRRWRRSPRKKADVAWHFVRSDGRIGRVWVDAQLAYELEYGAVAVVEHPTEAREVLVEREGVSKLLECDPVRVRFYCGVDAPADELICPPRFDLGEAMPSRASA